MLYTECIIEGLLSVPGLSQVHVSGCFAKESPLTGKHISSSLVLEVESLEVWNPLKPAVHGFYIHASFYISTSLTPYHRLPAATSSRVWVLAATGVTSEGETPFLSTQYLFACKSTWPWGCLQSSRICLPDFFRGINIICKSM